MKTRKPLLMAAAAIAAGWIANVAWSAQAADTSADKTQPPNPPVQMREQKVVLTGSHIPTTVKRYGRITDGAHHLTIIDRQQIQRSGAQTVAGVLARDPAIVVRSRSSR